MPDTKISALSAAGALAGTEPIPTVQAAATVATTPAAITTYVKSTKIALASDVSGTLPFANGGTGNSAQLAQSAKTAAGTVTTTSTTFVMVGLAGTVTPVGTGRVLITVCGDAFNTTGAATNQIQLYISSVAGQVAPTSLAAFSGTALGVPVRFKPNAASIWFPFSITYIATGLTLASAYWIDIGILTGTGANAANVQDINLCAVEF